MGEGLDLLDWHGWAGNEKRDIRGIVEKKQTTCSFHSFGTFALHHHLLFGSTSWNSAVRLDLQLTSRVSLRRLCHRRLITVAVRILSYFDLWQGIPLVALTWAISTNHRFRSSSASDQFQLPP